MRTKAGVAVLLVLGFLLVTPLTHAVFAQESFRLSPSVKSVLGMESTYEWLFGRVLIPAGGQPGSGTFVNIGDDLGVDQGEGALLVFRSTILDRHLLHFDYLVFAPSGAKRIPRTFRFQNKTYEEGTTVQTSIDFSWLRGGYGFRLANVGGWWLAPRLGLHYISHALTLNGETEEADIYSNTRRLDGVFPVLGFETRYLFPYGLDLYTEMEGIHLITRGYLMMARVGAFWEVRPDVVFSGGASVRWVNNVEQNQVLNNQWRYGLFGVSAGMCFTF